MATTPARGSTALEDQQIGRLRMWMPAGLSHVLAAIVLAGCASTSTRPPLAATAFPDADSVSVQAVAPGVTHTFIRMSRAPWAIHVLEVAANACAPLLEAAKPGTDLHARATVSHIARDAAAGVNADFFMLPRGTPVGAHVTAGVPLTGPTDRPVFAVTHDGWRIGVARLDGYARVREDSIAIAQVNRRAARTSAYGGTTDGLTLFTAWIGDSVPADSGARRLTLRVLAGDEARGRGIVTAIDSAAAAAQLATGSAALLARDWAHRRAPGDTVVWWTRVNVGAIAIEAVGGFPELLRDGRPVLDEQTVIASFGDARHPRTAVGWTPDERLLLLVVDGRQPGWSAGMSLDELTWLFQRLGASDALNLDGGGSTAMAIRGSIVNRPSDRQGERPVGNALLVCPANHPDAEPDI